MNSCQDNYLQGRQRLLHHSRQRAISCLDRNEFGRAFAHFVISLTVEPSLANNLLDGFLLALEKHTHELETQGKWNEVLVSFQQALQIFPNNEHILHGLGNTLYKMGFVEISATYFHRACQENPVFSPSLYSLDNIKTGLVDRWHFIMLNDKVRNAAYAQAIDRAVKSGYNHILDIGAGTGILSMMSVDAGAKEVYACECNEIMFKILQDVVATNEKSNFVHLIQGLSTDLSVPLRIPKRVNLVVTETFDAGLFGENILMTLKHAWEQLLCRNKTDSCVKVLSKKVVKNGDPPLLCSNMKEKNNKISDQVSASSVIDDSNEENPDAKVGKVIPHSATLWCVPVECERIRKHTRVDASACQFMNLTDFSITASSTEADPYTTERVVSLPGGFKYLSSPKVILVVNFNEPKEINELLAGINISTNYDCKPGLLDAFVLWFHLHLDDMVSISSAPDSNGCWEQAVFYVLPKHLDGSCQVICDGDLLTSTFHCQGHIALQNVRGPRNQLTLLPGFSLDSSLIYQLNAVATDIVIESKLWSTIALRKSTVVLDCSPFPVLGLSTLSRGTIELIVLDSENENEIQRFIQETQISEGKISFLSSEDLHSLVIKADLLIHQPVEICGLLSKQVLEKIAYFRAACLKESAVVIPGRIEIFAVLIFSPALYQQSKLISDEHTGGYKISSHINAYQTTIHQDIELSTLPHEKLSNEIKLCDIDLNCKFGELHSLTDMEGTLDVLVTKSGIISAIPFWFNQIYDTDCVINTVNSHNLWRQAASIPNRQIEVKVGDIIVVQWTCKNSCFHIIVKKVKDCSSSQA